MLAILALGWLYYSLSKRYYYEVRADISVQGESVEAGFLAACGNTLKGRFGHYQSGIGSFQGAELPQAGDARVMIVPLAEPCAGANKRKLKLASWFRLRPVALEADHFAVLLADDDGALIAPLPLKTGHRAQLSPKSR